MLQNNIGKIPPLNDQIEKKIYVFIQFISEIHACFQFYFHMRGDDIGDLNVIVTDKLSEISRWSKSGHYNSAWNRGFMSIPPNAEMVCLKNPYMII